MLGLFREDSTPPRAAHARKRGGGSQRLVVPRHVACIK